MKNHTQTIVSAKHRAGLPQPAAFFPGLILTLLWQMSVCLAPSASAQNVDIWTGNSTATANFSDAANWAAAAAPSSGDFLVFGLGGGSGTSLNEDLTSDTFGGITFTNGASAYTFSGNAFGLTNGITNNSTSLQTISDNFTLRGNAFVGDNTGAMLFGGVIDDAGNGYGITKSGTGALTLGGSNTFTGPTLVNQGDLILLETAGLAGSGSIDLSPISVGLNGSGNSAQLTLTEENGGVTNSRSSLTFYGVNLGGNNTGNFIINGTGNGNTVEYVPTLTMASGMLRGLFNNNSTGENLEICFSNIVQNPGTQWNLDRNTANSGLNIGGSAITALAPNQVNVVITNINGQPIANALIGGGGPPGNNTISVLPWATVNSLLAVYDPNNGLRAIATSELVEFTTSSAVFNALTSTQNAAFSNSGTVYASNNVSCNAIEDLSNTGTVGLNGTNTFTIVSGAAVANVGLQFGTAVNDGFVALGSAEGQFHVANTRHITVDSCITGTGGLTISLDDLNNTTTTATLAGTNTFSGHFRVVGNNPAMTVSINNALALQNATLDYNNYGASISIGAAPASLTFGGLEGAQNLAIKLPLTVGGDGENTTYSGILSGTGASLNKIGSGSLTLTAANTYTGGTTLTSGQLNINNGGTTSTNSAIGSGPLTLLGGTLDNTSGSPVTLAPNPAQTWNGNFTFIGSSGLNLGTGNVVLTGNSQVTVNAGTMTVGGPMSGTGFSLTKLGGGSLVLAGANTYSGSSLIGGGTLALTGSGAIGSPTITISNGATLDVSGISAITLGGSQILNAGGVINGSVNTSSGTAIYPGGDLAYGTNTFNNNLTLTSGATANYDLGTSHNGANDLLVVDGSLTLNGNTVHIKAPSTSASLDITSDYTLFTVTGTISGTFAPTPAWDVQPVNFNQYQVTNIGNSVVLHYLSTILPEGAGSANPASVNRGGTTLISVSTTNGTYPVTGVTLNASPIGGSSTLALSLQGTFQSGVGAINVYTSSVPAGGSAAGGSVLSVTASITDSQGFTTTLPISLNILAGTATWSGAAGDSLWSDNGNWVGAIGPASGDAVVFASTTGPLPVIMDHSYNLNSVTFSSGAGSFAVTNANSAILTLRGGVTNNSIAAQVWNVPIALGASQTFNMAAGSVALGGVVSGSGAALTNVGTGVLTLSGTNTYGGGTTVSSGTLVVANNAALGGGGLTLVGGSISNSAGAGYNLPNNVTVVGTGTVGVGTNATLTLSGTVSGGGSLAEIGGGALVLSSPNTFGGGITVNSGTLVVGNNTALGSGLLTVSGNGSISNYTGTSHALANAVNLTGLASVEVGTNDTLNLSGVMTNVGGLNVSGGGTLVIGSTASNSYSGGTVLNGALLDVENGSGSPLGAGALSLGGGTLENASANNVTIPNSITVLTNTSTTLLVNGSESTFALAGNISGPGSLVVNCVNSTYTAFNLTGTNSAFTGSFTVNGNTYMRLKWNAASAGSSNAAFTFNNNTTDGESWTFGAGTFSLGSLAGVGVLRQDATGTTTLSIGGLETNATWAGIIQSGGSGDQFAVTKVGTNTETFTANNTYTGLNEVAGGIFEITGAQQTAQPLQVDDGATFGFMDTGNGTSAQISNMTLGTNGPSGGNLYFTNIYASAEPLNVTGTVTNNGICVVTLADTANLYPGSSFPLIEYAAYAGSGRFVLSPLTNGFVAGLVNDPSVGQLMLVVPQTGATTPTNLTLTTSLAAGVTTLGLSWPANYQGWALQTNNVGVAATNAWVLVPGSEFTTSENITLDPTQTNLFIRLALP